MARGAAALLLLGTLLPGGGTAAAADPLIADSLAALGRLVTKETCTVGDAADGDTANGVTLAYLLCDDGLPPSGGGSAAVPVPAKYRANQAGNDWSGLPAPASIEEVTAADAEDDLQPESDNRISLDVDISLPASVQLRKEFALDPAVRVKRPPRGGWPVIVFMHGCCGGNKTDWEATSIDADREKWHHSNAWFASRGYVVVTYTARGFRNRDNQGSTGTTQLDSRRYEINDYQYLVGLLVDHDAARRAQGKRPLFNISPRKIGVVGGSYGGGFSWLALTDPSWRSPDRSIPVRLRAAVPKYGWTDLVESLVPGGHYADLDHKTLDPTIAPSKPAKALSRQPIGVKKQSIVAGLYATGNLATGNHTTFPAWLHEAYARLEQGEPYDGDPLMEELATKFLRHRSAYFQGRFWKRVANGLKVPVYSAATWTDPLFPTMEHVRFYKKLKKVQPKYPITMYLGDYQHFAQNKAKEWGDMCGSDHHVCTFADHRRSDGSLNLMKAANRVRVGINTRINAFLDYHLRGVGRRPASNVSSTTTICPANATEVLKADEPGIEYRARGWRGLTPKVFRVGWSGGGMTTTAGIDAHASESDPVTRDRTENKCFTTSQGNLPPGAVVYEGNPLGKSFTLLGFPKLTLEYTTSATDYWIAARLFDRAADGTMTMVTRGVCRVASAAPERKCKVFDLFGNSWRFVKGHSIVVEVTQADTPFLRKHNVFSTIDFTSANVRLPMADPAKRRDFRF